MDGEASAVPKPPRHADTIEIHGTRIRLVEVDAPESRQLYQNGAGRDCRWGQLVALALADHVGSRTVGCRPEGTDRYSRTLAVCWLGSEDVNGWLVFEGWALAYQRYSTAYVGQEDAARIARRGIWRGQFVAPWDWRKNH